MVMLFACLFCKDKNYYQWIFVDAVEHAAGQVR